MADFDDDQKAEKPLSARQQLSNLLDGLLDESDVPEGYRATPKERVSAEEMRKELDASRIDEAQAKDFLERLRQSLAEPELRVTEKDVERMRAKLNKMVEEHGSDKWQRKRHKHRAEPKPRYIN